MWAIKFFHCLLLYTFVDALIEDPENGECDPKKLEELIESVTEDHEKINMALHKLVSFSERLTPDFCDIELDCPEKIEIVEKKSTSIKRRLPTSCAEALRPGDPDGIQHLHCPGLGVPPFYAYCMQDPNKNGSAWTVILRRVDKFDFYRYFDNYKYGFGPLTGSHWLGLDAIHAMTFFHPHELWIELASPKESGFAKYSHFAIRSGEYDYEMNAITGFSGTISDKFSSHGGQKFSTRNNDFTTADCANERRGAWWFFDTKFENTICTQSHLNGEYGVMPSSQTKWRGIRWGYFNSEPINYALMAVRPKNLKSNNKVR